MTTTWACGGNDGSGQIAGIGGSSAAGVVSATGAQPSSSGGIPTGWTTGAGAAPVTGGVVTGGAISGGQASGGALSGAGGQPASGGKTTGGSTAGGQASGGASSGAGGQIASGGAAAGACDNGSTTTSWATNCPTAGPACTPGTFTVLNDPGMASTPVMYETTHFAFRWSGSTTTVAIATTAGKFLEDVVWASYFGSPIFFQEPFCTSATKYKANIVIEPNSGLTGGSSGGGPAMWIGPGALSDHWGMAHEFMHGVQTTTKGAGNGYWVMESYANFMPHQLAEYRSNVHCSEMMVNFPHVYYGSSRNRYCNWQMFEYIKDRYCYKAVNDLWTGTGTRSGDVFSILASNMGWNQSQLNDFVGEWTMHNVNWDYRNPDGTDQGVVYRKNYGATSARTGETGGAPQGFRRLRVTMLDLMDEATRRYSVPPAWAPQRFGYNVVQLFPDQGATSVTVTFRGVVQTAANSDWRWGLVGVSGTTSRYSPVQRGADGKVTLCVNSGEQLWLVVAGTPSVHQAIKDEAMYYTLYRFPWMVQLENAQPEGFQTGYTPVASAIRHTNGGGWKTVTVPDTVYIGPGAQVLGGTVSGNARIEDHAIVLRGTVSGNAVVKGLSVITGGFTVADSAQVATVFQGPGSFEGGQGVSGTAQLIGDIEYRDQGLNKSSNVFYGFVDSSTAGITSPGADVTAAPPYTWRP